MRGLAIMLAASLCGALVFAQSSEPTIADLARRLRLEERPRAVRNYTELDLPLIRNSPISIIGPEELPRESVESESSKQQSDAEKMWRQRFAQAREDIARTEQEIARVQKAFDNAAGRAARDMDWGYVTCPPKNGVFAPGYLGADNLNSLCSLLNERKDHLEAAKARLVNLEDDLRRAGGYPGWARE